MPIKENFWLNASFAACGVFIVVPWINPFAPGPSPQMSPLLVTLACAVMASLAYSFAFAAHIRNRSSSIQLWEKVTVYAWLFAGLFSSAIAGLQYFGVAADFSLWISPTRHGEAFANLRQRNQFATLTNISLLALLWLMLQSAKSEQESEKRLGITIYLGCLASGLLMMGNAASSSRTGLLELLLLCALCGLWGLWGRRSVRQILVWAALIYGVASFAMPYLAGLDLASHSVFSRLVQDEACNSRMLLWSNVLHLIAQKPWLGWGWGELDYAHFITIYNKPRFCDILDNAHNLPLHLAVELGVPVAVLVCSGFAWWMVRQKPWAERDATRQMAWAVLAVILLHSMVEYPLWYGPFQMAFGLCILMLWRQRQGVNVKISPKTTFCWPIAHILRTQAALISIALIGYAAWDYHRISQIYLEPESRSAAYRADTLNKIRSSWLFADQVQFAELLTTPLTPATAKWTMQTAKQLLHYSPEPRVVEKLIESAVLLGEDDDALAYLVRYKAAFPKEHILWAKRNSTPL